MKSRNDIARSLNISVSSTKQFRTGTQFQFFLAPSPPSVVFDAPRVARSLGDSPKFTRDGLWVGSRTKMAAALAGLPHEAQNQGKQQSGGGSDRSLRSVFGRLHLKARISIDSLNNEVKTLYYFYRTRPRDG